MDKKSDENLSDYYKVFIAMCKRQAGDKILDEEKGLEGLIDDIGEDHAKLILDRLELLSKLREVAKHPKLDERIKMCENNLDTPDWWESGKHDRELIRAVLKYGLYRSDQYILNDTEFPFAEAEKRYVRNLEVLKSFKLDNPADLLKLANNELQIDFSKGELKAVVLTPTKTDDIPEIIPVDSPKEPEKVEEETEIPVEKPAEVISDEPDVEKKDEELTADKDPIPQEAEVVEEKEVEKESEKVPETPHDIEATPVIEDAEKVVEEIIAEKVIEPEQETSETMEEPAVVPEMLPAIEESKMDVDGQEKPTVKEKPTKEEEIVVPEIPVEEKMDVDEVKTDDEPEIVAVKSPETPEEKEPIILDDEENSDVTLLLEVTPTIEELPEKVNLDAETSVVDEAAEKQPEIEAVSAEVVEIKKEPEFEAPSNPENKEQTVIDTVIIDDDDDKVIEVPTTSEGGVSNSKQAAELRARFPDLEVFQPLMKLKQLDAMMKGDVKDNLKSLSRVFDSSMVVKWFRDFALEKRVSHIIYCVENSVWPVGKSYSAYSGCLGIDLDLPLYETVKRLNTVDDSKRSTSSTPDIITITTDHHQMGGKSSMSNQLASSLSAQLHQGLTATPVTGSGGRGKKAQKRHIAIDVETERAKLHALLNSSAPMGNQKSGWSNNDDEKPEISSRRSAAGGSSLQPPPAHQHQQNTRSNISSYKPTVIPGTSSTLTPIDLSSR